MSIDRKVAKRRKNCPGCGSAYQPVSFEACTKALAKHHGREWDEPIMDALTTGMSLTVRDRFYYETKAVLDAAGVKYGK